MTLELPQEMPPQHAPDVLRLIARAIEKETDPFELMDGSFAIPTPWGSAFLHPGEDPEP